MEILENAEGLIKVPGSIFCAGQPKVRLYESYHDTREQALTHWLEGSKQQVIFAKRNLRNAEANLKRLRKRLGLR